MVIYVVEHDDFRVDYRPYMATQDYARAVGLAYELEAQGIDVTIHPYVLRDDA